MNSNDQNRQPDSQGLAEQCRQFLVQGQGLAIACSDAEGKPHISYVPYSCEPGGLGLLVLVSELALHTRLLRQRGVCEVILLADSTSNPFARQRLSLRCRVETIARDEPGYQRMIDQMQVALGDTVSLLNSLGDFHLLRLQPEQGRYILGFGRAHDVTVVGDRLAVSEPVRPQTQKNVVSSG